MSKDNGMGENSTEAPSSENTKSAEQQSNEQSGMLSEEEFDFVNLLHQYYQIHGVLLTAERAVEVYKLPASTYNRMFKKAIVKKAITERGIKTETSYNEDDGWRALALSGRQIIVADTMLNLLDRRSYAKKLRDLKVTPTEWNNWLKQPEFARYLDENTQSVLKNGQHEAALALMVKVSQGDLKAIQFYYEYTGRFLTRQNATTNNPNADAIDAKRILQSVVEIIIDEVEDHATASRIADRLKSLITAVSITDSLLPGNNDAGNIENSEIMPEVVENRALTPAMKDAMSHGIGMET